ncbi:MAG: 2-dehydropantoate 2-reductase [Clostridia bacterium]|nr:2-dehydropantoate 2-reductase [Clostridia bacterium]
MKEEDTRVAIYGAGAMGTVLSAYISRGGGRADVFDRKPEHVRALNEKGARVKVLTDEKKSFSAKVRAYLPSEMEGEYDIIVLFTKQSGNAETVKFLFPHLKKDGVICTCQNGLPEDGIAEIVGKERCLGCVVSWGATYLGPGEAVLSSSPGKMNFAVGSPYGDNPRIGDATDFFSRAGKTTAEENFLGARVAKLAVNAALSPLSGMSGLTFGEIAKDGRYRKIALEILHETFRAAKALGIRAGKIQGHNIERLLDYEGKLKKRLSYGLFPLAMKAHIGIVSGIYYDLKAGKKSETDYINGAVTRLCEKAGTKCPANGLAAGYVRDIENGGRQISTANLDGLVRELSL